MLVRLGKDNDAWGLKITGIVPMMMRGRRMNGWVRAAAEVFSADALRGKLLKAALDFNRSPAEEIKQVCSASAQRFH